MTRLSLAALLTVAALPLAAAEQLDDPVGHWAEKLNHKDVQVRMEAVVELGKLGPKAAPAAPAIADRLESDKDARVRLGAAGALGKIGPDAKAAVPALIGALKDEGFDVASWSATALGKIGPGARDAVPALTKMLGSYRSSHSYTAAVALGDIGPDAKAAVPELLRMVEKNFHHYAPDACLALWRIEKHPQAVPALIRLLKTSEYSSEVGSAACALGQLGPDAKAAVPQLVETLANKESLVASRTALALWQIDKHEKAVPTLIRLLTDESTTERYHAAWRLQVIGPPAKEAVPALVKNLGDKADYVAPAAADALKAIDPEAAKTAGVK